MSRRLALVALPLLLVVGSLAACTESTRIPPAEPPAATEPLFASDEEALAAATAAYEEFLLVSGEILQDGGQQPERLKPLVSDEVYESESQGFNVFRENSYRATGSSRLEAVVLQQHIPGEPGNAEVQIYTCVFVGDVDVVDLSGVSVVDPQRQDFIEYEALFSSNDDGFLRLESETVWGGGGVCA
ncbi:hypothetical protein [Microcella sp.]|uniref:hypothetical protein n=1 Tax=Microcella sp. TaxID=1913979 RepID=UPI003F71EDEA